VTLKNKKKKKKKIKKNKDSKIFLEKRKINGR